MRIWVDDVRPAPEGDVWCKSVNDTIAYIVGAENRLKNYIESDMDTNNPKVRRARINLRTIQLIDIDHDAGDYANDGGDYIKLLDWLEKTGEELPYPYPHYEPCWQTEYGGDCESQWLENCCQ